ncbi:MAG: hypothetical protein JNL82_39705 [Myxococcales bacterium]|nr:hypothetical protein [Myxococcales bacterium]
MLIPVVLTHLLAQAPNSTPPDTPPIATPSPPDKANEKTVKECITNYAENAALAACLARLDPAELAKVDQEDLKDLTPEVLRLLPGKPQDALGSSNAVDESDSAAAVLLRDRNAIRPSLRIVGDTFGSLVTGNAADDDPETSAAGAFGGGLDVRTLNFRSSLMIRKGSQPRTVTGETEFGSAMLLPQIENFAVSADFTWFPDWYVAYCRSRKADKRGSCDENSPERNTWRYQLRRSFLLGPSLMVDVARTHWKHVIRAEESAAGMVTAPQVAVTGDVTTLHAALGARYSWVRSHKDNWVEVSLFVGPSWRRAWVDSKANKTLEKIWADVENLGLEDNEFRGAGDDFLASSLGTTRRNFFGLDIGLSIRVNDLVVSATLPYVAGDQVSGLDGFRLIPMLSLRGGFELVKLGSEAARAPKKDNKDPAPPTKATESK